MLTSLLAFEIIENSFSCRKIASYPVYKLSVSFCNLELVVGKQNKANDNNQSFFGIYINISM